MKLKYNFAVNKVADKFVAVAVGGDLANFSGFLKMNDCGAAIFEMLKNDVTEDEICAELVKRFPDGTEAEAHETTAEFVGRLKEAGLLV